jgi:hypothetical protein
VPPEEFIKMDLPPDTVFAVRFKQDADVNGMASDAFDVLVNSTSATRLAPLLAKAEGPALGRSIAASVIAQVVRGVLSEKYTKKLPADVQDGLLAKLVKSVKEVHDVSDSDLLLRARDRSDPFIEACSQLLAGLDRSL